MQSPEPPSSGRRRLSGSLSGRGSASGFPPPPPAGSLNNGSVVVAPVFERFHSFKEFMLLQKDTLEAERAVHLYDQYRHDFKVHTARTLFSQYQNVGFVRQRFDPALVRSLVLEKIQTAQVAAPKFVIDFNAHMFDSIDLSVPVLDPKMLSHIVNKDSVPNHRVIGTWSAPEASTVDVTESPFFGFNPNKDGRTLIVRKLPGTLTREELHDVLKDIPGLVCLTLMPSCLSLENQRALLAQSRKDLKDCSEAEIAALEHAAADCYIKSKPFMMPLLTAWLEFDTSENCAAAELALEKRPVKDICVLSPLRVRPTREAPVRVCSICPQSRIAKDLETVVALILALDKDFQVWKGDWPPAGKAEESMGDTKDDKAEEKGEKAEMVEDITDLDPHTGAETHPLLQRLTPYSDLKKLDICLLYLRRVHYMDYYSAKSCWTERELFETCGAVTVRLSSDTSDVVVIEDPAVEFIVQQQDLDQFDKKIKSLLAINWAHWRLPVDDFHPLFGDLWGRFCEEKTVLVDSEKFRCGICRKLFKGAEFVHKHLKNKHVTELEPVKNGVTSMMMKQAFEADDQKLLLFIQPSEEVSKSFQSIKPLPVLQARNSDTFQPVRRGRPHNGGERPYRDWDAPKQRLQSRSAGGNFRSLVRYDDL
eukprot:Blabericola_migrator_1__225@NODE_1059_length_5568_cov_147_504272_g725_i1_p2_GENE_NODE_1059_length_5568_cov_147_504272_g725_i1NODE_1059_length_5568_cov_147_504272_g725_i1_p2_ORF_typecomplete_len648_score127_00ARS2/PF04959_13/7e18DUF3546/PF12066_8/1_1e07cSKI_SMAD_bind/PF08782_10/2_6e03cSKI_SMAD_bind/PF08782_10/0_21DUF629/PF04780_12/7_5e03DUF629/PF04780_12/0_17GSH_synthase/PF03199_15/0_41GSH_synthase/PF03199_15/7_8e03DUF4764/PF15961_5/0_27zfBED/PF02892_15/0_6DUF4187/PF13821_6/0_59_NODE_1059_length_